MKKLFFIFVLALMSVGANSQDSVVIKVSDPRWTDIGVYFVDLFNYNTCRPVLWVCHENGNYYLETRLAFDWVETAGVFAGKTFGKSEKFWVTPKLGFLFGFNQRGYNGFSPEVNLGGNAGRFEYFLMNQIAISFQKKNPHFFYNYTRVGIKATKWLSIQYPVQIYVPFGQSDYWLDQGPQLNLLVDGKIYIQPWYTFDVYHKTQKFIIGFGYKF